MEIEEPELWWPAGYGEQPLYKVVVALTNNGTELDRREYLIGLRKLELRQQPDEWGRSFAFVVNGRRVFCKGANWIPADAFPPRITPEKRRQLLVSARDANMNMLRVWGGGYYEDEQFYELCDRLGLLVWQDFMFACAMYPFGDPEFLENVHEEVRQNVRRLRQHACLALWCGNNEMELGWVEWGWGLMFWLRDVKEEYERFFHHTLPDWVHEEDQEHAYWPSSPFTEEPLKQPNAQSAGDAHYWAVWHQRQPFSAYRDVFPRFMSEFGFQSLPTMPMVKEFAPESEWKLDSQVMLLHQRSAGGNSLILAQMAQHFREPKDFEALDYTSMILQAEGIRFGVEHWRRHRGRVMGILYWQLNDVWPALSWSSLDYSGRWKALHYYAKRFYTPLLLSIEDQGTLMEAHLTNDRLQPWQGELAWTLETLVGEHLDGGSIPIYAQPECDMQLFQTDFREKIDNRGQTVLICELRQGEQLLQRLVQPFVKDKQLELQDPELEMECRFENGVLAIKVRAAKALARYVELELEAAEAGCIFSDNYFDLPAGREAEVRVNTPEGWSEEEARRRLRVRSLWNSYRK